MPRQSIRRPVSRRSFLQTSAATAAATAVPRGVFAGGDDRLRVGLVGCGGRGTAAAIHALAAGPGVEIVAIGDRAADQVSLAADALDRAGNVPRGSLLRFVGDDAADRVIAAGIDLVILATPPHLRPAQAVAAIRAGRHVACEAPVAVDAAGVRTIMGAAREARIRGLSFLSGFDSRHHAGIAEAVARIHDGVVGQPTHAVAVAELGPTWRLPRRSEWTDREHELRNWIDAPRFSGGPLVEHQVHAIDRMLWAFGDEPPVSVAPLPMLVPLPAPADRPTAVAVLYRFRDGRTLEVGIDRREGIVTRIDETVHGLRGRLDLRAARFAAPSAPRSPHAASIAALVDGIRSGRRLDDVEAACRSTMVAVMGRDAAEAASGLEWSGLWPTAGVGHPSQPLQSSGV